MGKKLTTQEFIEKVKAIHGNRYDYSLVNYRGAHKKINIICLKHGVFVQTANNHYRGNNCPKCYADILKNSRKDDYNSFISKVKKLNNKYDYSLVEYVDSQTKVKIICSEHGVFEQTPNNHITKKQGCPICGGSKKLTTDIFIQRAKKIHNNKYDYSKSLYMGMEVKIDIICSKHGIFKQVPKHHLNNHGCPICNESKGEKAVAKYLDDNNIKYIRQKRFNDCRNKHPLSFDFYVPKNNILIEYDGIQHFEINEHFGGKKGLEHIQKNDGIKNKYCKNNNIKLIRIKYNENIKNKLELI